MSLIIRNGSVVDGTGNPWYAADVRVVDAQIVEVGRNLQAIDGCQVIDASGLVVAPGFVDIHGHSDYLMLADPVARSKIRQGVTTDVAGNCGYSAIPQGEEAFFQEWWTPEIGERFKVVSQEQGRAMLSEHGIDLNWKDLDGYYSELRTKGMSVNYATFVGHVALRLAVMGEYQRKPNADEMDQIKEKLDLAMRQGAFGISTECGTHRNMDFDLSELEDMCQVIRGYGGRFAFHIRDYGDNLLESMEEALWLLKRTGVPGIISHILSRGRENWGKARYALQMMEEARRDGVDVIGDIMPYGYSEALFFTPYLRDLLPEWSFEGGSQALVERLNQPDLVARLTEELRAGKSSAFYVAPGFDEEEAYGQGPLADPAWPHYVRVVESEVPEFVGRTFAELAADGDTFGALFEVLRRDPDAKKLITEVSDDDHRLIATHPLVAYGTDGGLVHAIKRPGLPNPTLYGVFPYILRRYVREEGVLSLEEAVRKMTSLATRGLGLRGRGLIEAGNAADIVVFDPDTVSDVVSYDEFPAEFACGIEAVVVNGVPVLLGGEVTGELPGEPLLNPGAE